MPISPIAASAGIPARHPEKLCSPVQSQNEYSASLETSFLSPCKLQEEQPGLSLRERNGFIARKSNSIVLIPPPHVKA
jgi:hypothetical protein